MLELDNNETQNSGSPVVCLDCNMMKSWIRNSIWGTEIIRDFAVTLKNFCSHPFKILISPNFYDNFNFILCFLDGVNILLNDCIYYYF